MELKSEGSLWVWNSQGWPTEAVQQLRLGVDLILCSAAITACEKEFLLVLPLGFRVQGSGFRVWDFGFGVCKVQPCRSRYRFIDGSGNFGSEDGEPPAAMRCTSSRASMLTERHMDTCHHIETLKPKPLSPKPETLDPKPLNPKPST